jgi:carbamoyltransferase
VVFYEDPYAKLERVMVHALRTFPSSARSFAGRMASQVRDKLWVLDRLARHLGVPRDRVGFVPHHRSHAASAWCTSPWRDTAVLTVDGVGEWQTSSIWHAGDDGLRRVEHLEWPHSLGMLYAGLTGWLGFRVNEGEYKVMGLAAYGQPRFREAFGKLCQVGDDGSFQLDPAPFAWFNDPERGFGPGLEAILGPARVPGRSWSLDRAEDARYADVAATLQQVTEEALVGLARRARRLTGADRLCLAGGVALNAVANARLAREAGFHEVYVHPAAGDAGGAVGAAYLGALELGTAVRPPEDVFLGLPARPARAHQIGQELGLTASRCGDPDAEIAARLAEGQVVARCTGRAAWGPRALGARSLLASPHAAETREHLNRTVKHREAFRPFAPAVLDTAFSSHFEGVPSVMTEVMTTVRRVLEPARLAAVTHVDGTARVQSVTDGAPLGPLLTELQRGGHDPIVLNTSLNGAGEPVVGTETHALAFFLRHPVDALYVGDVRITR